MVRNGHGAKRSWYEMGFHMVRNGWNEMDMVRNDYLPLSKGTTVFQIEFSGEYFLHQNWCNITLIVNQLIFFTFPEP